MSNIEGVKGVSKGQKYRNSKNCFSNLEENVVKIDLMKNEL